jgi:hypothetical protein
MLNDSADVWLMGALVVFALLALLAAYAGPEKWTVSIVFLLTRAHHLCACAGVYDPDISRHARVSEPGASRELARSHHLHILDWLSILPLLRFL